MVLALGLSAGRLPGQAVSRIDDAEVRRVVDRVVSSPDFRHLRTERPESSRGILERLLESLFGDERSGERGWTAWIFLVLVFLVGGAVVTALIVITARAIAARAPLRSGTRIGEVRVEDAGALRSSAPPGELSPEAHRERALALARAGEYRAAIRHLLLGCMSWVERAGLIRFRTGLTNHDYLRATRRRPGFHAEMVPIVRQFEEIHFGRRPASEERFHSCLEHLAQGVREGDGEKPVA
jgi:hypothetical protein